MAPLIVDPENEKGPRKDDGGQGKRNDDKLDSNITSGKSRKKRNNGEGRDVITFDEMWQALLDQLPAGRWWAIPDTDDREGELIRDLFHNLIELAREGRWPDRLEVGLRTGPDAEIATRAGCTLMDVCYTYADDGRKLEARVLVLEWQPYTVRNVTGESTLLETIGPALESAAAALEGALNSRTLLTQPSRADICKALRDIREADESMNILRVPSVVPTTWANPLPLDVELVGAWRVTGRPL